MSDDNENLALLKDVDGGAVALQGVTATARIADLLASIEVAQTYRNPQSRNIEAVYTFPLPVGAVLLGLEVEIGGKTLVGTVTERKQAERDYENAITDGNSAIMLEEAGPGLYTASLGNLMAGESAVIRYRYALPLSWQGSRIRFLLPTTIAPRYGDALAAGMRPHQVPTSSLMVEYPLELAVTVSGLLADATVSCPSHPVSMSRGEDGLLIRLPSNAVLDRDFVLTLEAPDAQSACVVVPDGDGQVAMASLRVPPVALAENQPLSLNVVIDCSGSMAGTSIAQARKAALEILKQLRPSDRFNVTLFGSNHEHAFRKMVPASAKHITQAWERLERLDADMGGTEMERALASVFSLENGEGRAAVLLITDGEIHEHQKLVKRAENSGHRVFVVGVGTAVAEAFLKSLANATGGSCELVAPQEGMADTVLSQFHRIRQPKLQTPAIRWPVPPAWQTPLPETVFAGDTVHVFAGFATPVSGAVQLSVPGTPTVATAIGTVNVPDIPRIAAANRLGLLPEQEAAALAVAHQLLSKWTNYLVIAEREVKADALPAIHHVPQMVTAGQLGAADFSRSSYLNDDDPCCLDFSAFEKQTQFSDDVPAPPMASISKSASSRTRRSEKVRIGARAGTDIQPIHDSPLAFVERLEDYVFAVSASPALPQSIRELETLSLHHAISEELRNVVKAGNEESTVVVAFLHALIESAIGNLFSRNLKRQVQWQWKAASAGSTIDSAMSSIVTHISDDAWVTDCTNEIAC